VADEMLQLVNDIPTQFSTSIWWLDVSIEANVQPLNTVLYVVSISILLVMELMNVQDVIEQEYEESVMIIPISEFMNVVPVSLMFVQLSMLNAVVPVLLMLKTQFVMLQFSHPDNDMPAAFFARLITVTFWNMVLLLVSTITP
jgi:hypothetical protein